MINFVCVCVSLLPQDVLKIALNCVLGLVYFYTNHMRVCKCGRLAALCWRLAESMQAHFKVPPSSPGSEVSPFLKSFSKQEVHCQDGEYGK